MKSRVIVNLVLIGLGTILVMLVIGQVCKDYRCESRQIEIGAEAEARREKRLAWEAEYKKEVEKLGPRQQQRVVYQAARKAVPNYQAAKRAVKQTITKISTDYTHCQTGVLEDGIAVMVTYRSGERWLDAAYWVRNGRVYAANGIAKMWSPTLSYSKASIHFDSVEAAINK